MKWKKKTNVKNEIKLKLAQAKTKKINMHF